MSASRIREIADKHAAAFREAFGAENIDAVREAEIERAAESLAIADFLRRRMVDEGTGNFDQVDRAEAAADLRVQALGIPQSPKPAVTGLTVRFVGASDRLDRLSDEELDTLEALAQKVYGDAGPENALDEADSRTLRDEVILLRERCKYLETQLAQENHTAGGRKKCAPGATPRPGRGYQQSIEQ
jgi:hypothetical protein